MRGCPGEQAEFQRVKPAAVAAGRPHADVGIVRVGHAAEVDRAVQPPFERALRSRQPAPVDVLRDANRLPAAKARRNRAVGGRRATRPGVAATDPRVIPFYTHFRVEGLGVYTALDTGGAIKGNRIDIWHPSRDWCIQFGRQRRTVTIL